MPPDNQPSIDPSKIAKWILNHENNLNPINLLGSVITGSEWQCGPLVGHELRLPTSTRFHRVIILCIKGHNPLLATKIIQEFKDQKKMSDEDFKRFLHNNNNGWPIRRLIFAKTEAGTEAGTEANIDAPAETDNPANWQELTKKLFPTFNPDEAYDKTSFWQDKCDQHSLFAERMMLWASPTAQDGQNMPLPNAAANKVFSGTL